MLAPIVARILHPVLASALLALVLPAQAPSASSQAPGASAVKAPMRIRSRLEFPTANGGEAKPTGLLALDLDGDGKDELCATTRGPGSVQVWTGLSPALAAFPEPRVWPLEDYPLGPVPLGAAGKAGASSALIVVAPRASRPEEGVLPSIEVLDARAVLRGEVGAPVRHIALERRPRALASGDLGLDGKPEIVVVTLDDELCVYGAGDEPARQKLGDAITTCVLVLADGTGIVTGSQAAHRISQWRVGPDGRAITRVAGAPLHERAAAGAEPDALPRDLDEVDVDADGDTELLVAGGDESVWIFGLDAPGGIAAGIAKTPRRFTTSPVPVDLEHRSLGAERGHELVALGLLGLSYGRYHAAPEGLNAIGDAYAGQSPVDACYGDFDGDGSFDLAIANTDAGRVSVTFGDGQGGLVDARFATTGRTPHSLAAGDLTGDGFPEVLVLDAVDGKLTVAMNAGGKLENGRQKALAKSADAVQVADLDGDGRLDAAFVAQREHDAVLTLLFGEGGELFERAALPPLSVAASQGDLLLADLDSDGRVDALVSDPQTNRLILLHNGTEKGKDLAFDQRIETEVIAGPRGLARLSAPSEVAVALAGPGARIGVAVLRLEKGADGGLAWREISSIDAEFLPLAIASSDFDGDGRMDLAVLVAEKNADSQCFVQPCLRLADGNWRSLPRFPVGYRPYTVAAGDLDGDGRGEILVSAQNSHHVELWTARAGDPVEFVRTADLGVHAGCLDVLLHDLDRDGRPEVIVANGFSNDLGIVSLR